MNTGVQDVHDLAYHQLVVRADGAARPRALARPSYHVERQLAQTLAISSSTRIQISHAIR